VLAPSRYMCEYLHGIGVSHATHQPLGVDLDTFSPNGARRDLRAELGLARDSRVLVFAGRFSAEKNVPVLMEAFRRLGDPFHLLLIGGDATGREGNVTRLPYCRDNPLLASYLRSADAFVHAGVHETFGLVILEALACGRPVVAMRAGAVPELLDERVGCLAEPHLDATRMAARLADAIAALYDRDPDMLGAEARRHVASNFSWTRTLQGLMAHYQAAVSARRLPIVQAMSRAEPAP